MITRLKTKTEIAAMRQAGQMLATVLKELESQLQAGMSTKDLAEIAKNSLRPLGGQPTFLGYQSFPDVLCVSVNDEVVHGIPRADRVIKEGDIVSLDFGVTYQGMITDSAITLGVGKISSEAQKLIDKTEESLWAGIKVVKSRLRIGDIGAAVGQVLEGADLAIIRDLVGHGVGHGLHEEPNIANYGRPGTGFVLESDMTIAIEPMASLGSHEIKTDQDGWTIRTADGSLAAHFEHTLLVTDEGSEILTELKS